MKAHTGDEVQGDVTADDDHVRHDTTPLLPHAAQRVEAGADARRGTDLVVLIGHLAALWGGTT